MKKIYKIINNRNAISNVVSAISRIATNISNSIQIRPNRSHLLKRYIYILKGEFTIVNSFFAVKIGR